MPSAHCNHTFLAISKFMLRYIPESFVFLIVFATSPGVTTFARQCVSHVPPLHKLGRLLQCVIKTTQPTYREPRNSDKSTRHMKVHRMAHVYWRAPSKIVLNRIAHFRTEKIWDIPRKSLHISTDMAGPCWNNRTWHFHSKLNSSFAAGSCPQNKTVQ